MAEQRRREFREGDDIEYLRDPGSRNIEWSPGRITSFVKYIIRNNQTGRTSERGHFNVRLPGYLTPRTEITSIGDTVLVTGRGQPVFEGTVADKIFSIEITRQDGSRTWIDKSSYEIRRPGEEAMQRPARPQRQAQAPAVAPTPAVAQAPAVAQEPVAPAQEPAPAVDILQMLDRETQEQLRLARQDRQEFEARNGERYTVGERVEARLPGATINNNWRPATITRVGRLVVRNNSSGREMDRQESGVRDPATQETGETANLRIRSPVEIQMFRNQWVPGILISKNYSVQFDGADNIVPLTSEDIRRPQGQAPAPAPAVAPAPQRQLRQPTEAVAFEIHNAFDSFKFDKFMDIVRKNSNFKNRDAPLKPLIDNVNANPNLSPEKKTELAGKIERIFTTLRQYSNYDRNINNIMDCIQYVLMQPQDFIDIYIDTFITDCLKAYSTGSAQSCVKGMYERVYFAFRDTVSTICLDQIQGTGAAPLCKPEYIQIFDCFYEDMQTEMLNDYAQQWFQERGEEAGNFSEENRIEDFVGFVRSKVNNVARFRQAERSVRKYAATNINVLFGGRRSNSCKKKARKTVRRRKNITMKKRGNKKTKKQS
jgi:hypothetical protein